MGMPAGLTDGQTLQRGPDLVIDQPLRLRVHHALSIASHGRRWWPTAAGPDPRCRSAVTAAAGHQTSSPGPASRVRRCSRSVHEMLTGPRRSPHHRPTPDGTPWKESPCQTTFGGTARQAPTPPAPTDSVTNAAAQRVSAQCTQSPTGDRCAPLPDSQATNPVRSDPILDVSVAGDGRQLA
jgi:hypothetical protein